MSVSKSFCRKSFTQSASFYTEITVTKQKKVLKNDQKSVKLKEELSSQRKENIEKIANYLLALIIERYTTVMWKGEFHISWNGSFQQKTRCWFSNSVEQNVRPLLIKITAFLAIVGIKQENDLTPGNSNFRNPEIIYWQLNVSFVNRQSLRCASVPDHSSEWNSIPMKRKTAKSVESHHLQSRKSGVGNKMYLFQISSTGVLHCMIQLIRATLSSCLLLGAW